MNRRKLRAVIFALTFICSLAGCGRSREFRVAALQTYAAISNAGEHAIADDAFYELQRARAHELLAQTEALASKSDRQDLRVLQDYLHAVEMLNLQEKFEAAKLENMSAGEQRHRIKNGSAEMNAAIEKATTAQSAARSLSFALQN